MVSSTNLTFRNDFRDVLRWPRVEHRPTSMRATVQDPNLGGSGPQRKTSSKMPSNPSNYDSKEANNNLILKVPHLHMGQSLGGGGRM